MRVQYGRCPCAGAAIGPRAGQGCGCHAAPTRLLPRRTTTTSCTRGSTTRGTSWSCRRGSSCGEREDMMGMAMTGQSPRANPHCSCTDRAAKQRRKGDRIVIDCQEQAYWLVNRPPVRTGWEGHGRWHCAAQARPGGCAWGSPQHVAVVAAGSSQRAGAGPRAQELPHHPRAAGEQGWAHGAVFVLVSHCPHWHD